MEAFTDYYSEDPNTASTAISEMAASGASGTMHPSIKKVLSAHLPIAPEQPSKAATGSKPQQVGGRLMPQVVSLRSWDQVNGERPETSRNGDEM